MLSSELKASINKLWDKFWAGGLANPLTSIEQISYLIFIKRLEELDNQNKKRAEARGEKFTSVFDGTIEIAGKKIEKETCRWSHWKNYSAEKMMEHVQTVVFPFIKSIRINGNNEFSELMKDAIYMIPKASLLQEAVSILDNLEIAPQNYDTLGDLYEYLLSELSTAGKTGQFRTPRHIIRMMVELVQPKLGEKVCDPACGTAGFLVNAYQYVLRENTSQDTLEFDQDGVAQNLVGNKITNPKHWEILRKEMFYGYDFDQTMVRIASMNMTLHGIERPNIIRLDALSKGFEQKARYDVILANPPFTGSIDKGDVHDSLTTPTGKTELLFLELFHNLLNMGGRAAIIVPNGVLFGSSKAHVQVRRMLMEKGQLEAVISMPSGVFKPYSGVGTTILVFTKGGQTEKVWFYDMKSDGYSLDDKRQRIDGKGDIPEIIEAYRKKTTGQNCILVNLQDIKEKDYNLSISRYQKHYENVKFDPPREVFDRVERIIKEMNKEVDELRGVIK